MTTSPLKTPGKQTRQSWRKHVRALPMRPLCNEKTSPVCPSYEQPGQGHKLVGSNSTVPRPAHRDGMTTRWYLAAFTAKIQRNA